MEKATTSTLLSSVLLLLASVCSAQEQDAAPQSDAPYEVIVTPQLSRSDLRSLISRAQKDYVSRFNELNIDDKYDIACYRFTPTGSHIEKEVCEPVFLIRARGDDASWAMAQLGRAVNLIQFESVMVDSPDAIRRAVKEEYEVLQEKVEKLTASDSLLRSIATSLNELNERLTDFGKD